MLDVIYVHYTSHMAIHYTFHMPIATQKSVKTSYSQTSYSHPSLFITSLPHPNAGLPPAPAISVTPPTTETRHLRHDRVKVTVVYLIPCRARGESRSGEGGGEAQSRAWGSGRGRRDGWGAAARLSGRCAGRWAISSGTEGRYRRGGPKYDNLVKVWLKRRDEMSRRGG